MNVFNFFIMCIFILFFFNFSYVFAYIDPGTGGYLISSIWSAIVGFFAIILGIVIRFFRHTLKNFIVNSWKNHKILFILSIVFFMVIVGYAVNSIFVYSPDSNLPEYDESLNGAHILDEDAIYDGYNLYNGKLIDMEGNVVRTWDFSYLSILDDDGYYYAQECYECLRWGKFTFDGEPVWILEYPIHHEIYILENGNIMTMTKEAHEYNGRMVEFDVLVEFDKYGNIVDNWSTWENLEYLQSFHKKLELDKPASIILPENHKKNTSIWGAEHDYYHMNSFSEVPVNSKMGMHPAFNKGNWLVSFRHGSMTFLIDKDTKKVLWRAIYDQVKDNLEGQHVAYMLENGNIMIFDNGRYRGWSRIAEIHPVAIGDEDPENDIIWEYRDEDFFTYSQGYFQVLPNGNFFIVESESGYVFEMKKDGTKVWEYYLEGFDEDEKFGTIREEVYRMYRYDKEFIDNLLKDS